MYFFVDTRNCIKSNIKFPFAKLHIHTHKAVSLRIDCFFRTQKGVIDLCVRFTLLVLVLFALIFMGYMSKVVFFSIAGVIAIGQITWVITARYLDKKM